MGRRIVVRLMMRYASILSAAWLFIWGASVLVLRVVHAGGGHMLPVGGAGLVCMVLGGMLLAWRKRPNRDAVRALLDSRNACCGLLVASSYAQIDNWQSSIEPLHLPRVKWESRTAWALLSAAALFAVGSVLLPVHNPALAAGGRIQIRDLVEELNEQCEVLEELEIIEEHRAVDISEQLKDVWEQSSAQDPAQTWEALDHIEKTLSESADEAASEMLSQAREIAVAEVNAEALSHMTSRDMAGDDVTQAMNELGDLMKDIEIDPRLLAGLDTNVLAACENMTLTPDQLAELSKLLKACEGKLADMMAKMCEARLVDPSLLKQCEGCFLDADAELAAFLDEGACGKTNAIFVCNRPGRGGITRGRGDAPMTWTDGTSENDVRFKEENLSPASLADLKESRLVGMKVTAPSVTDTDVAGAGGGLSGARAGGGMAHRQPILPKHRGTVTRYFERKE